MSSERLIYEKKLHGLAKLKLFDLVSFEHWT